MPQVAQMDGVEISEDEARAPGWNTALGRHKRAATTSSTARQPVGAAAEKQHATSAGPRNRPNALRGGLRRLATASRLPPLPKKQTRVIIRAGGGLDVRKLSNIQFARAVICAAKLTPAATAEDIFCPNAMQNIYVVSTPNDSNASAYSKITEIAIGEKVHNVSAYLAAPNGTCKGVIRGIDAEITDQQIRENIVNKRNPKAIEARRIKKTPTVVILFEGWKVPNYVTFGVALFKCSLYKRQTDICYACGRIGHRADVCPNPSANKCRACGADSPATDHECSPKCGLCGGPHPTGDKKCKGRYQVPYVVRRRRQRRNRRKKRDDMNIQVFDSQPQSSLATGGGEEEGAPAAAADLRRGGEAVAAPRRGDAAAAALSPGCG